MSIANTKVRQNILDKTRVNILDFFHRAWGRFCRGWKLAIERGGATMANEKKRILIIDDEEPIRFALSTILKEQGHEVDACETGGAGLEKLMEKAYNLILLDYNLPDMDGLRVAQRARELDKDVSIVFISAYGTTDVILRAVRLGAFDFIKKPIHSEELFSSLNRWANTRKEAVENTLEKVKKALPADNEVLEKVKKALLADLDQ